ncbi:MAG: YHS domain protein [Cyclobacteriaceae bacterium]|nr:YHS domain protein [Cyclobacteriaceae bacterium]
MKQLIFGLLISLALISAAYSQNNDVRSKQYNLKKAIALEGYDPVSYFSNHPIEGKSQLSYTYKNITYWFANQTNLNKFKSNPDQYEPAYGGWCAYAMGETGEKVKVDPETYKILNGKLYLFYNFWGNNTLTDWNKNEKDLKSKADQNWKKIVQ